MDHAFEMILKAAILKRGGRIREKRAKETIGFDACIRRALSDSRIQFLSKEQVLLLQTINGLRDAAQHHLLDISESQLYMQAQAGLTLFRDLMKGVFDERLEDRLPKRVLPLSTSPPVDIAMLFDSEIAEIRKLLGPKRRRKLEAEARLRPLAILESTINGEKDQPSSGDLNKIARKLMAGTDWKEVFKGASAIEMRSEGQGPTLALRFAKKEGIPIQVVPEGTPGASVVALKRVNELDFYNLGATELAQKVNLSISKTVAVVDHLNLRSDPDCYKVIRITKATSFKRYSQKAIEKIKECLLKTSIDEIWKGRKRTA